jgi:general secretion pathway protein M
MTLPAAWTQRSEQERRILAVGAALAALLLFIAFVAIPLERTRSRLAREVPELRAAVGALQKDAGEARRLRSLPPAGTGPATSLAAIAAGSLAPPPGARLTLTDAQHVKLAGEDIAFGALVEWLATSAAAQGLRVERARLEALGTAGRVRADLTLGRS